MYSIPIFSRGIPFYIETRTSRDVIELLRVQDYEEIYGILIFEPPGRGKSSLAKYCAKKVGKYIRLPTNDAEGLGMVIDSSILAYFNLSLNGVVTRSQFKIIMLSIFSQLLLKNIQDLKLKQNDINYKQTIEEFQLSYKDNVRNIRVLLQNSQKKMYILHIEEVQGWVQSVDFQSKKDNEPLLSSFELKDYYLINICKLIEKNKFSNVRIIFTGTSYSCLYAIQLGTLFKVNNVNIVWDIETTRKIFIKGLEILNFQKVNNEILEYFVKECEDNGRSIQFTLNELEKLKKNNGELDLNIDVAQRCVNKAQSSFWNLYRNGLSTIEQEIFRIDIVLLFLFFPAFSGQYSIDDCSFIFPIKFVPARILRFGEIGLIRIMGFDRLNDRVTISFPKGFLWNCLIDILLKYKKQQLKELFIRFHENYRSDKQPGYSFQYAIALELCSPLSKLYNKVKKILNIKEDISPCREGLDEDGNLEYSMESNRIHELDTFNYKVHEVKDHGTEKKVDLGVPLYFENNELKTFWELKNYEKTAKSDEKLSKRILLQDCYKFFSDDLGENANELPRIFATPQNFSQYSPRKSEKKSTKKKKKTGVMIQKKE